MAVTSANRYLTRSEMEGNARFISDVFLANGWTMNAVAAMLGNMESESTINPGIYEGLDASSSSNGFGLVQWTPNTKYKTWADANGYGGDYGDIVGQVARILYELREGLQWIPTSEYPLSFVEFTRSTESASYLAQAFLYNYERPASLDQPHRSTQAEEWLTFLGSGGGSVTPTPSTPKRMSKILMYYSGTRRRL